MSLKDHDVHEWHQKHLKGMSLSEIGHEVGRSYYSVQLWFQRNDLEVLPRSEVSKRYHENLNWSAIKKIKPVKRGRGYSQFTAEEGAKIKQFLHDNPYVSVKELSIRLGVKVGVVTAIVYGNVKYTRPKMKEVGEEKRRKLFLRYKEGETLYGLAKESGILPQSLRYTFKKLEKEEECLLSK